MNFDPTITVNSIVNRLTNLHGSGFNRADITLEDRGEQTTPLKMRLSDMCRGYHRIDTHFRAATHHEGHRVEIDHGALTVWNPRSEAELMPGS